MLGNAEAVKRLLEVWLHWAPGVDWIVGIGFLLVLLPVLLKLLRLLFAPLSRLLFRTWLRFPVARIPVFAGKLLPDQEDAVKRLLDEAQRLGPGQPGRMVGLRGEWGSGKSFVVQALLQRAEDRPDNLVAVRINIWEDQREQDLHLAVVRAALGHPELFEKFAPCYPWRLLFAPFLNVLGRLLPNGLEIAFGGSQASLKAGVSIPMIWQQSFQIVIAAAVSAGWKFVIILDEIDRADPPLAQAAITLARRALDLPGVLVVLPYVEEQIRYKVFNPANVVTPDLAGTLEAILDEEVKPEEQKQWLKVVDKVASPPNDAEKGNGSDTRSSANTRDMRRQFLVRLYFDRIADAPAKRESLFRRFSEKYLSWSLKLEGARGDNLAAFVLDCDTVFRWIWKEAMRGDEGVMRETIRKLAKDGSPAAALKLAPGFTIQSLRSFEGLLDELLADAKFDLLTIAGDAEIVQARLAAIVAIACALSQTKNRN